MKNNGKDDNELGFAVIEVMLVLAIMGIIAGAILRIMFASDFVAWENKFWSSMGFAPELARLIIWLSVICSWAYLAIRKRQKNRKKLIS